MRRFTLVSILFILWVNVAAIAYGTHLQVTSANYNNYRQQIMSTIDAGDSEHDYGPGVGVGLALTESWEFVACYHSFIAGLGTIGVFLILLGYDSFLGGKIVLMTIVLLYILNVLTNILSVPDDWKWSFYTLFVSKCVWSICLVFLSVLVTIRIVPTMIAEMQHILAKVSPQNER